MTLQNQQNYFHYFRIRFYQNFTCSFIILQLLQIKSCPSYLSSHLYMQKDKNHTAQLKKVSQNIQSSRKGIQANQNIIQNIGSIKSSFNQMESIIKGQTSTIDATKTFSKQVSSESSKNLQIKKFFNSIFNNFKTEMKNYMQIITQNFVASYKQDQQKQKWAKLQKQLQKSLNSLQDQADTSQKMFDSIQKLLIGKQNIMIQIFKSNIYKKNILWRDLNAPYDDYIHGQVKAVINLMKANQQKLGYIPAKLEFKPPKFDTLTNQSNFSQLVRIHLFDYNQVIQGLKNYSKLNGKEQVIQDISKNQHIVKGLRQRIQKLTINYQNLMQKYRNLQISKGKVSSGEQKSIHEKLQDLQGLLLRKDQQIIEFRQANAKSQTILQSAKDKNKQLEDQLSKFQKFQIPKIKQLQVNQKNLLQQFAKVRRDLQTYSSIVTSQREQKLSVIQDLKVQKKRVNDLVFILGRQKRKIKQLKQQLNRKEQIIMELVDKVPDP